VTYLDTHVVIWLYAGDPARLGSSARKALLDEDLRISPMVCLELEFLHEIGRLKPSASRVLEALAADIGLTVCPLPFEIVAKQALKEKWTRDPFDRLIVANARVANAALVSKDATVARHYTHAVW
jgi:PIN domain nuclease of toxin-antitoxin system